MKDKPPFKINTDKGKCTFRIRKGYLVLKVEEITAIESFGAYLKVWTIQGIFHIVSLSLKQFEESCSNKDFLRIHESHIINGNHIWKYENTGGEGIVSLHNGKEYKVSRARRKMLIEYIESL